MTHTGKLVFRDITLICFLLCILFFGTNGVRPLGNPDEGRYSEIPREMLEDGSWVSPRVNGVLYFDKPPLFYWLQALALKVGGLNEKAARFWPAAFALAGCLGVYVAGRRLYNRSVGLISVAILSTSLMYFSISQLVVIDMAVSVFITFALLTFLVAISEERGPLRRNLILAFYIWSALAVLTKGLIGVLIPVAIIGVWLLITQRWKKLFPCYLGWGILVFMLIAGPWHFLAWQQHSEFAWYYFVHEHFLRFMEEGHGRNKPIWFFFVYGAVGLIPWLGFLPGTLFDLLKTRWRKNEQRETTLFLVIWIIFVIGFFSASSSKLIPYILPIFPALSLLIAIFVNSHPKGLKIGMHSTALLTLFPGLLLPFALHFSGLDLTPAADRLFVCLCLFLVVGGIATSVLTSKYKTKLVLLVPFSTWFVCLLLLNPLLKHVDLKSSKTVALKLLSMQVDGDQVFCLSDYHQDLPFYLNQKVSVVDSWSRDINFGLTLEDHSSRFVGETVFRIRWEGDSRIFAVARSKHLRRIARDYPALKGFLIFRDKNYVLISNKPSPGEPMKAIPLSLLLVPDSIT